jgi:hypothetical protein
MFFTSAACAAKAMTLVANAMAAMEIKRRFMS